ncbi:Conserved exported protein of uncharacterised function [Mycobacterium tuberculosis]|nr:Conserved exported protein of uncharacterised function [Mycobacterium tuberculosis]CKO74170.1 Conserved exported protein of uncharacterised function [Mycobacterium tuberculosis]CKS27639.1 Conserved exported protein of uncharacterised function [Mycobacterium tuberculosis]
MELSVSVIAGLVIALLAAITPAAGERPESRRQALANAAEAGEHPATSPLRRSRFVAIRLWS